ncbi:hypothetical protein UCRPA7_3129 [Phaeoacremonium minimum UCRPA7]|uniref:Uncharacterized protein n=1 Tax=Phaeoacremonium minimum (strain UCR-PA7) TaxID=1286976 RepID=R8BPW5_PHAM7|nr:hypothetical protein UCRPA7_3129 [Phaeoacremonium minimum UCRPA7]EOO01372.1 hypothetical protein UCRPA7_3129 [Phaeoacremonium minimum UCRPA7]
MLPISCTKFSMESDCTLLAAVYLFPGPKPLTKLLHKGLCDRADAPGSPDVRRLPGLIVPIGRLTMRNAKSNTPAIDTG